MEQNPLHIALQTRIQTLGPNSYVNLIDSNFLDNGYMFPPALLADSLQSWLRQRQYHPEPKGDISARNAIADFYDKGGPISRVSTPHPQTSPDDIILTASSSESYNMLFQSLCQPGDNILLPKPGYPLFEDLARANHLECRYYSLQEQLHWQMDCHELEEIIDENTKFVVVISPNNPCGSVLPAQSIKDLGDICRKHNIMLISDEVFSEFLYESPELPRPCHLIPDIPIFTINGISKIFALPDLKLSWLLVSGDFGKTGHYPDKASLMQQLELRNDTFLSCNSLSQFILPQLFNGGSNFTQSMVANLKTNQSFLKTVFQDPSSACRLTVPQGGIHCVLLVSRYHFPNDEDLALDILNGLGIYLHPGYLYGMDDSTALIISILKDPEIFKDSLLKLFDYFKASL